MNIIVICSDTFRYDHLGFLKKQEVFTPNLDQLAKESASFSDFKLCSFPTVVNRIEVFSGRCAFPRVGWDALPYHYPVMSQVFKRHGFVTALVADNVQLMKPDYNFKRGFDHVEHIRGQQHDNFLPEGSPMVDLACPTEKLDASPKRLVRYRRNAYWYRQQGTNACEEVFRRSIKWLEQAPQKFFLWIDCFDPHEPWDAPDMYLKQYPWDEKGTAPLWPHAGRASHFYSPSDMANMRSLYKAEVTQSDHWIGQLLAHLRKSKLLANTAVIFCSDHGHYFGEHDMVGKFMKKGMDRPTTIYDEIGHIPLLLRHPEGVAAGQTISGLCQPQDLLPTLLELAGVPKVPWAEGNSLVPRLHGQPGEQEFAVGGSHPHRGQLTCLTVWSEKWTFIYSPWTGMAGAELYDRQKDPNQIQSVIGANRSVADRHYELLVSWFDRLGISKARQRQMLHNEPFPWNEQLKHRAWMLRNRAGYFFKYSNY